MSLKDIHISMPCLFGTEGIAANEIKFKMGITPTCENGRVSFCGEVSDIARANILLSCVERVQILLGTFKASTFDELFCGVKALPLYDFIPKDGAFPVKGWSLNSKLTSIPDCQSIVKKAAVECLKQKYQVAWFEETGAVYQMMFSIMNDTASIYLDTSGAGLHKRGYRKEGGIAPIKETLVAAIADCARVKAYHRIIDPCCGSGTLLIEAARKALNIAPGLDRHFACERWNLISHKTFHEIRDKARSEIRQSDEFECFGYDIVPEAVELTLYNAEKAGVGKYVKAALRPIETFKLPEDDKKTVVLANPPYGERLADIEQAKKITREMGERFIVRQNVGYYIISPEEEFERIFGRKAQKRRKLYNGMIKCDLYMYY